MTATDKDRLLAFQMERRFHRLVTPAQARILRRAAITLHRWAELECGGNRYGSWAIERDDDTGIPYFCVYPHSATTVTRTRIPDREAGALNRVATVCADLGLSYYHQTDPRGCALYVSDQPLTDMNYTNGMAVSL